MADRFDKFTERARRVLTLAQEEAQRFNHNYIGTEHLLLGLVREGDGVAAKVLANLGVEVVHRGGGPVDQELVGAHDEALRVARAIDLDVALAVAGEAVAARTRLLRDLHSIKIRDA